MTTTKLTCTTTHVTLSHVTHHMSHVKRTVIRVTPPSTAAAPTMAYIPGVMQRLLCEHEEKKPVSPTSL